MGKAYGIRLPDDLSAAVDERTTETGWTTTKVIIEALRVGLARTAVTGRAKKCAAGKCPHCGSALIAWGAGMRCEKCARNF